jgi:hypothetical protein
MQPTNGPIHAKAPPKFTPNTAGGGSGTNQSGKSFESNVDTRLDICDMVGLIRDSKLSTDATPVYSNEHAHKITEIGDVRQLTLIYCTDQNGLNKVVGEIYRRTNDLALTLPSRALRTDHPDETVIKLTISSNTATNKRTAVIDCLILEKRAQYQSGSVIQKIFSIPASKYAYTEIFKQILSGFVGQVEVNVHCALCVNGWLKNEILNSRSKSEMWDFKINFLRQTIPIMYGDDDDYGDVHRKWVMDVMG